ncbi:hypothetical protein HQN90_08600 [Paenibacillus alba]|uniref:hypothetical protein n=1 Tax=Paenibacillus alba TaxID=1197127 RepID=UPI001564EAEA|nr:hypothetical protein [Paenibacillus alba]NQX66182.1 hypothetical protein [Paenibacillus alba]
MVKMLGTVILLSVVLLLNACEDSTPVGSDPSTQTPIASQAPFQTSTVAASSDVLIRSKLQSLSFGQQNSRGGYVFLDWKKEDVPKEPFNIVYYLEDVNVNATFTELSQAERLRLTNQIRIEGNVEWKIDEGSNFPNNVRIQFIKPSTSFVLHLGDLPAMTFIQKEPLNMTFTSNAERNIPHLLLWANEYAPRLLVTNEENSVNLTFSEEMRLNLPTTIEGAPIAARWMDNKHLYIQLEHMRESEHGIKELTLRLDSLMAQSGNRFGQEKRSLVIQQMPKYEWRYANSGELVEGGPRERFYDQILLSNDKQSYIGIIRLGGSLGDGDGTSYSFILEQQGKDPVVIEDVFYSTIEPDQMPIQWMDSRTLMYASYFGVYAYDIEKAEKRVLHDNRSNEEHNFNYASYDKTTKLLHLLAYENRNESGQLELLTYTPGNLTPQITKNFTMTVPIAKYSDLDMTISPTPEGIYWTRIREGIPYTEFVGNSGDRAITEGITRLVSEQGAYLEQYQKTDNRLQALKWKFWKPGESAKAIEKPPEGSYTFVSGSDLFSFQESAYNKFDRTLNKWVAWRAPNGEKNAEPIRGKDGLYRSRIE